MQTIKTRNLEVIYAKDCEYYHQAATCTVDRDNNF